MSELFHDELNGPRGDRWSAERTVRCGCFRRFGAKSLAITAALSCAVFSSSAGAEDAAPAHSAHATSAAVLNERLPPARLGEIIAAARSANHELKEASARTRASTARAETVSRWPDPMVRYELWAAPLVRPYDAQMHMFGVSQVIPAPGTLSARAEAATEQSRATQALLAARERDLVAQVRRAYAEYAGAYHEYRIHLEHIQLTNALIDLSRASYQAGRGTQQDVLKTGLELARVHSELIGLEQRIRSSRALLNALMARSPDSPLGPPEANVTPRRAGGPGERFDPASRPEIAAGQRNIAARSQELKAARNAASYPEFMVQAQYMYMPMEEDPHAYGVMLAMSVPWFNSGRSEEVRAAEQSLVAERQALKTLNISSQYELADARARTDAALRNHAVLEQQLLPQARRSYEAAVSVYRAGAGSMLDVLDASRTLLDLRIQVERSRAAIDAAYADLLRARGERVSAPAPGGTP